MSRFAAVCVVVTLMAGACAPAYSVRTEAPGFDGKRTIRMQGNLLGSGGLGASDSELNLQRVELGPDTVFRVELRYTGDGVAIDAEAPLELLLPGDTLLFVRDSTVSQVSYDRVRLERALYQASEADLVTLAAATEATVRFRLGAWTEDRRLGPRGLERIRAFVQEQVRQQ